MIKTYEHDKIENKWKDKWYKNNLYKAEDFSPKPKKYILAEFPYPSGTALHAGHMMRFTVPDVYSRFLRMNGYNVMFPMGWDAFGLPAENYAVKTGINPAVSTKEIIGHYRDSLLRMGYGIDLDREINTTDPKYYKWTQWIFLKLLQQGLAEYKEMPIWWCEKLRTVLADEEVLTDKEGNKISERGEYPVEKRMFKQWVLKMPAYAEKLLQGLNTVDFPQAIKSAQANWIDKSEGAAITFELSNENGENLGNIEVFTTRPDTIYGVTFMAIAPDHPKTKELLTFSSNKSEVEAYLEQTKNKSDLERQTNKDKTGVQIEGVYAKNPLAKDSVKIPLFTADYILMDYGTGTIMGVPAHDERDYEFAKKFNLEIINVIKPTDPETKLKEGKLFSDYGIVENSEKYNDLSSKEAFEKIINDLEILGKGHKEVTYRLRDWVFSRQRYWGEPIPVIHKETGEIVAICNVDDPEDVKANLPLVLPEVPDYTPTADGSSPLDRNKEWVHITDKEGKPATRETNTMPNWAGSSWYYLRYIDPKNDDKFADYEKLKYWLPVDRYFGGAEHTTLHLLYSRFWHKFLYDQGLVPTPEPYAWRLNGGLLLGPDGKKMSKSKGNVVEPMDFVQSVGADALRMFICFLGPYEDTYPWNEKGIKATARVINTIYESKDKVKDIAIKGHALEKPYNLMVKKITGMVQELKMNTVVSEIMIFVNEIKKEDTIPQEMWKGFIRVLAPITPFLAEELWQEVNNQNEWTPENSVHVQKWPEFDETSLVNDLLKLPIQVNGKLRAEVEINIDDSEETVKEKVMNQEKVKRALENVELKKFIYIKGKVINLVI